MTSPLALLTSCPVMLSVLLFLGLVVAPVQSAQSLGKPNIILILADDLGYGELGCYGQKQIQTPQLDRLAAEGMRFTQFYAGSTVCAPSRCVLMTGKHTGHCTVRGNAAPANPGPQTLRPEDVTVAEVLHDAGYTTGLIGKWGLGDEPTGAGHPNRQGFDYFYGYLSQYHAHNHYPDYLWRNRDRVPLRNEIKPIGPHGAGYATQRVEYAGDLLAAEALAFIERNQSKPFFLYYAPVVPHANNERTRELKDGQEVPDYGPYADKSWPSPNKGQAAMITRLDADIGRLVTRLRELKIADNTLILFSSDNGPHKEGGQDPELFNPNGPLRGYKRDLTDGGIRVPFLAWWPGKIAPGQVSEHVGYFGDFLATAAELAGANSPGELDSTSFAPALLGRAGQRQHDYLYWEFHEGGSSQAVLLENRWKGIRLKRTDAPLLLYDLKRDPGETRNVSAEYPKTITRIQNILATARTEDPNWPLKDARVRPNIVLIISDDHAWNDYRFMGHPQIATPHLDRLASQSLTFRQGYVTASLCCPSLASIITGRYPHQHKIANNDPPLPLDRKPAARYRTPEFRAGREKMNAFLEAQPTLPRLLAQAGYASFQAGKWWQGDYSRGGFTHGMTQGDEDRGGRHGDAGLTIGRQTMEPVFDFIADAQREQKPFFVWYAPMMPHDPHTPPERLLAKYQSLTNSLPVARYWAMVEWFDETCGQLLQYLDQAGLAENTIVAYLADNGWIQDPESPRYAPKSKQSPYNGGLRTPIMVRWPGHIKPQYSDVLASSVDLMPTLLRLAGVTPPPGLPGMDLTVQQPLVKRNAVYGACFAHDAVDLDSPAASLNWRWMVSGRWKLIVPNSVRTNTATELYDLRADPLETRNLAEPNAARVEQLRQQLNAWWTP